MLVSVSALPLVLCGPMLRRVDTRSVSVFVALKAPAEVQIELHERTDPPAGAAPFHVSERHPTVALGRFLHVVVATLRIPDGSAGLSSGQMYGYDVVLHDAPTAGAITRLAGTGMLGGSHPLGFVPGRLPGFAVMPDDLSSVRVVHGSCRKPHGEGDDMLVAVDDLIGRPEVRGDPFARPHLLLLTGDQIYADDVAPGLLRALHDTGNALLGWEEVFAGTGIPMEDIEAGLADLVVDAQALVDLTVPADQDAVIGLQARLEAPIDVPAFSDPVVEPFPINLGLKKQLERFAADAADLLDLDDDELGPALLALAVRIATWRDEQAEIFADLSSARTWGRIAGFADEADAATAAQVRTAVEAAVDNTAASAEELLAALADAVDEHPSGLALADLLQQFRDEVFPVVPRTRAALVGAADQLLDALAQKKVQDYVPSRISPPQRAKELRQFARLTSDAMDAHLMFLGEFYAMYLFAFSPAAWPVLLPDPPEAVPNYGLTGALSRRGLAESNDVAKRFAARLPQVRRVLANVPTLMAFDDHEVTDDWNLHLQWVAEVNASTVGPRLLRNALAAYAVFQDWGNQPHDYVPGTRGRLLLDQLEPPADDGVLLPPPVIAAPATMDGLLGVGPEVAAELPELAANPSILTAAVTSAISFDADGPLEYVVVGAATDTRKRWDWTYEPRPDGPLRFLALDTRTRRAYPTTQWGLGAQLEPGGEASVRGRVAAPMLIDPDELARQLGQRLSQTTINVVISPAPVFGLPLVEELFQRLQALTSGPEVADFEPWQANRHGFDGLLKHLRVADTVLLSGDVHYAYTNVLHFPEADPNLPRNLCVQLTSSSLKNETGLTRLLGTVGRENSLVELLALDDMSSERIEFLKQTVEAAALEIGESIVDAGRDLMDLRTWYDETAPLLAVWNPESWVTYWLKLKDELIEIELPSLRGIVAIGSGLVSYVLGDFLDTTTVPATRDGEIDRGDFAIRFLADRRDGPARIDRASTLNGVPATQVTAAVDRVDLKLAQAAEVVGFNNVGQLGFPIAWAGPADLRHELVWETHRPDGTPEGLYGSTVHADAAVWPPFAERVAVEALRERARWHPPSGEIHEYEAEGLRMLEAYRRALEHLNRRLPVDSRFWQPVGQDGSILSWSGWFICLCMQRAGAGIDFPYSSRHIDYIRRSKAIREAQEADPGYGPVNPFYLYGKDEEEAIVQVGDVVVYAGGATYGQIDVEATHFVSSHCDVVVEVTDTEAQCIGGNVEGDEDKRGGDMGASGWTCNFRAQPRELEEGRLTGPFVGIIRRRDAGL